MRAYLDHNATTPLKPAARAAMLAALEVGNASSVHRAGRQARRVIEDARDQVAAMVGGAARVIFTSGATEANALALAGLGRARVLVSAIEHDSVLANASQAERIPVSADGVTDLAALERMLDDPRPTLVAVMAANNETGAIQPVAEIARLAHAHGALVLCDAAQAGGKIALDLATLGVDALTLSAHKLGGPQGAGALMLARDLPLAPLWRGGGQELGSRAGTENVAAIAGFGAAAQAARADLVDFARLAALRDRIEAALRAAAPGAVVFAAGAARLPNTSCIAMPGVGAETQIMALDLDGVAVSAGAACSSGKLRQSHVLGAMGVAPQIAATAIRISLGWDTRAADADAVIEAWIKLWTRAGARAAASAA